MYGRNCINVEPLSGWAGEHDQGNYNVAVSF